MERSTLGGRDWNRVVEAGTQLQAQGIEEENNMDILEVNGMGNNAKRGSVRRRGMRLRTIVIQFSGRSASSISNYETNVEDDVDNEDVDVNGIKHFYSGETWSKDSFIYNPQSRYLLGEK